MNISPNKLQKLTTDEIIKLLNIMLTDIYNTFSYINLSHQEYQDIVKEEIAKTRQTYTGTNNKPYQKYLHYKITNRLTKIALKNPDTSIIFINNYISKKLKSTDPISNLNSLSNFFSKFEEEISPNLLILILNNKIIQRIIKNFIKRYQPNNIDEMFDSNIIFLIETYCYQNNITLEIQKEKTPDITIDTIDTSDIKNYYFAETKNIPLLTAKQERNLFEKVKLNDKSARDKLIESNQRLVIKIAAQYQRQNQGVEFLDLVQEGNIALMTAIDKFDTSKNYRFSTYATCCIKGHIQRYIDNKSRNIRIPIYLVGQINQYRKVFNALKTELNREPTIEEYAQKLDMPASKVQKLQIFLNDTNTISLNSKINDDPNSDELEQIISSTSIEIEEKVINHQIKEDVINILSKCNLKERELEIIKMYFGFPPYDERMNYKKIGKVFNLTYQRVEQIVIRAIDKIKESNQALKLAELSSNPSNAIKEINLYKERTNKMRKTKTIYQILENYGTKEEIDQEIESLSEHEKSVIYRRYNNDLTSDKQPNDIPNDIKKEFYQNIIPKMKRHLQKKKRKQIMPKDNIEDNNKEAIQVVPKQDEYTEILERIKTINFSDMLKVLSIKEAIIVSLRLGLIDNKYFSTEAIANFLGIDKDEVKNTTIKVLLLYKDIINKQIDETIKTLKRKK